MALLVGQHMSARELEMHTSPWEPVTFASMCNALAWAVSGIPSATIPSFTERVNDKDGGIDAEWQYNFPEEAFAKPTPIIGSGWNVFQYKKRDNLARDRRRILSGLKSSLPGELHKIKQSSGNRLPDRYVLFLNVDIKHNDKIALRESLLSGLKRGDETQIEVLGAGELAALLNNHPHLRASYFQPLSFSTWKAGYDKHINQKIFGSYVKLIGREEDRERLKSFLEDRRVRAVVIHGPHDVGKSRLVLEATRDRQHDVVLALDPRSMGLSDYRALLSDRQEVVCIVEDLEEDRFELLVNEALSEPRLKLLISLPTSSKVTIPSYGRDERVQLIELNPLDEQSARKLLRESGRSLPWEIEEWILRQAGGLPGVLLAAADVGPGLRDEGQDLLKAVGQEFERRIEKELGHMALKHARLFSLMTHVGISGAVEDEIRHICEVFGDGWNPQEMTAALDDLEKAGVTTRGGSFVEIKLPLLANYLAISTFKNSNKEIFLLWSRLGDSGIRRLLKRLSELDQQELRPFWDAVFDPKEGLLKDFQSALKEIHILKLIAGTVPDRVLRLLEAGLIYTSREERLQIAGDERRNLMWTLEQLLFRRQTSASAFRVLWLLAEAENETYGNNASGVLAECFHPLHPHMPLPLQERITLFREFTDRERTDEARLAALNAAADGVRSARSTFTLRHSTGPEPLDSRPVFTLGEAYDYFRDLVELFLDIAAEETPVGRIALNRLPNLAADLCTQGRPADAPEVFRMLVDWAVSGKKGLDISALTGSLQFAIEALSSRMERGSYQPEQKEGLEAHIEILNELAGKLDTAGFFVRLKRWAGDRAWRDDVSDEEYDAKLRDLAKEAVESADLLSNDVLDWMMSPNVNVYRCSVFFRHLGTMDVDRVFLPKIEELAKRREGAVAFGSYWGGWARGDREGAEARLEDLARKGMVTGEAIVAASRRLGAGQPAVDRILGQLKFGRVEPKYVAGTVSTGAWLAALTPLQFEQIVRAILGEEFGHAAEAMDLLNMWIHHGKVIKGSLADLAWQVLESHPAIEDMNETRDLDRVTAKLANDDPERGFALLQTLAERPPDHHREHWDPLDKTEGHGFWEVLYRTDRERLFQILFRIAQSDPVKEFRLSWRMREIIDQDQDRDILVAIAGEGVEQARMVAGCVTTAKGGFWPIAFVLVRMHPHDEDLLSKLTAGIEQQGTARLGPAHEFLEARKQEVKRVLEDPATPLSVKHWLQEVMSRLEKRISYEIVWDYDMKVEDLRRHIRDKESPQRIWAIGRVLKMAKWEDIRQMLSVEDIQDALPHVDLPEKKRKMLESALEVWQRGL